MLRLRLDFQKDQIHQIHENVGAQSCENVPPESCVSVLARVIASITSNYLPSMQLERKAPRQPNLPPHLPQP